MEKFEKHCLKERSDLQACKVPRGTNKKMNTVQLKLHKTYLV